MGNSHSKKARSATYPANRPQISRSNSKVSSLTLTEADSTRSGSSALNLDAVSRWEEKLLSDPKNRLALGALTTHAATAVLQNPTALLTDTHIFSHKVELEGSPVTNQRSSGRCWIFAATNVFRVGLMRKYKLSSFELSQSYLFFWDKLEKANFFLEQVIDTVEEPLDGRLVQYLLSGPVGDGGQWDMIVNLVEKYGLVPQTVFPDSFNAKASGRINWLITVKLREAALTLRDIACNSTTEKHSDQLHRYKSKILQEIYGILTLSLGAPPKPDSTFVWNYVEKDGKYHSVTTTPLEFYNDNMAAITAPGSIPTSIVPANIIPQQKISLTENLSLVNDPRNPYLRLLTVDRLGNIHGARGVTYINVDMATMKAAITNSLKANHPVFFGCDVGKFSDPVRGVLDTHLYDYELGFNVSLGMDKAQRLRTGESAMTHAMVISGVNVVDGVADRWRVENSWGDAKGERGYLVMADRWMDEYCYQAVVRREFVSDEVRKVLEQEPVRLPIWDPMGSLA